jgi:hypothetical protein
MRIASRMTKATNTHSEYVTLIVSPQQQWLHEFAPVLRCTYSGCTRHTSSQLGECQSVSQTALWVSTELPAALCVTSGFRRQVVENCALLGYYAASGCWTLRIGPIGCPETSVRNCHCWLRNNPEQRGSHLPAVLLDSAAIFKVPARCDDIEVQDERHCVFDLSWLCPMNYDKTMWLASSHAPTFCCCSEHSHLSLQVTMTATLLHVTSLSAVIWCILCSPKRLNLTNLNAVCVTGGYFTMLHLYYWNQTSDLHCKRTWTQRTVSFTTACTQCSVSTASLYPVVPARSVLCPQPACILCTVRHWQRIPETASYEACPESKDTKVLTCTTFLIYKSDTVNKLPVHNYFST